MWLTRTLTTVLAATLVAAGCAADDGAGDDDLYVIVTTLSPITNLVSNIACGQARVKGLVPEGINSHTFEPRPSDVQRLSDADVVFVNGLNLETPTIRLAEANISEGVEIVQLASRAIGENDYIFDVSFPSAEGNPNPHLWTNPEYAAIYAEEIADVLSAFDPDGAVAYRERAEELAGRFRRLAEALRVATATVPESDRKLLTYHDSFPYFAREFGWEIIGAIQPSDFSEPSPRDVANLINQIRDERVPAIFGSEVFPSSVLNQIAAESGTVYIDNLRDDDLPGEPADADHSLLALLVFDYQTIIEALGGDSSALNEVPTANICQAVEV